MDNYSIFKGLSKAYVESDPAVASLFEYHFSKEEDFKTIMEDLKAAPRDVSDKAVAEALRTYNEEIGCGEKTLAHIKALENGALAVVTGQQAGVFTGALYTVYKAITTIKLAKDLTQKYGETVVPIFWIASEDHDFAEIHELKHYASGKLSTYSIEKAPADRIQKHLENNQIKESLLKASVGHLKVTPEVENTIEAILNQAGQEEVKNLEALLKTTFLENDTLSNWFGRLMAKLFRDYGLVFVDPMLDNLRSLETPLFKNALSAFSAIQASLESQTEKVSSLGFKPSLDFDKTGLNLFYYAGGERLPIKRKSENEWVVTQGETTHEFTTEMLQEAFELTPDRFSTNVVLRPVAQDYLLRTIAYVAGPGEISYYSQLKKVYGHFGKKMPIIYPRENFTVVNEAVASKMDELGLEAEALLICGVEAVRDKVLDLKDDIHIDEIFSAYMEQVDKGYEGLIEKIAQISPEIYEFTDKNKGMILNQIAYLQEKAHRFHRRNHKDILKQISDIGNQLLPEGGLQERTLSVLQYYGKQGDSFIHYLVNELPLDTKHRIIKL